MTESQTYDAAAVARLMVDESRAERPGVTVEEVIRLYRINCTYSVVEMAEVDAEIRRLMEVQCDGVVYGCRVDVPREQMTAPLEIQWLAEADDMSRGTPDAEIARYRSAIPSHHGSNLCWDCRRMALGGVGPASDGIRSLLTTEQLAAMRAEVASAVAA